MKQIPNITDAEWLVMKVLWSGAPRTANEIIGKLSTRTEWKPKTVKTLIDRLVRKKAVGYEPDGRAYLYYPLGREEDFVRAESRSFLQKVYDGATKTMLAHFIQTENLSPKEIDELKEILEEKSKGGEN